jgi:PilZ domain
MSCTAARGDIVVAMTHFPQPNSAKRSTRVKFGGSVLVAIRSEAGGTVRAKLQVLSTTGGLFVLAKPLEPGDFVQVTFQTSQGAVRGMAEILQPTRKSTFACLQPFRFVALDDEDHARLRRAMELQLDKTMIDVHTA